MGRIALTDPAREVGGVWENYLEDIRLRIARLPNPKYLSRIRELSKAKQAEVGGRKLTQEENEDVNRQAIAETVLTDWEKVETLDGKPEPYSSDAALVYFRNPKAHDFYDFVCARAMAQERFRLEAAETLKGN